MGNVCSLKRLPDCEGVFGGRLWRARHIYLTAQVELTACIARFHLIDNFHGDYGDFFTFSFFNTAPRVKFTSPPSF